MKHRDLNLFLAMLFASIQFVFFGIGLLMITNAVCISIDLCEILNMSVYDCLKFGIIMLGWCVLFTASGMMRKCADIIKDED